jgi:hypothetical protein
MNGVPWALLIGAGFSKEAGVPTARDMVNDFQVSRGHERDYVTTVIERLTPERQDVEGLLEVLEVLADRDHPVWAVATPLEQLDDEKVADRVRYDLRQWIRNVGTPDPDKVAYIEQILRAVRVYAPFPIFTFNYDCCVEIACHRLGRRYDTGFAGTWHAPPGMDDRDAAADIHLYKLHGSVLWYRAVDTIVELPLARVSSTATTITGEPLEPIILYPGDKERLHVPPFSALHERWRHILDTEVRLLITIGYSFRDAYVADIIRRWLVPEDRLLAVLDPDRAALWHAHQLFGDRAILLPLRASQAVQIFAQDSVTGMQVLMAMRNAQSSLPMYLDMVRDPNASVRDQQIEKAVADWFEAGLFGPIVLLLDSTLGTQIEHSLIDSLDFAATAWLMVWAKVTQRASLFLALSEREEKAIRALPAVSVTKDASRALVPSLPTLRKPPRFHDELRSFIGQEPDISYLALIEAVRALFAVMASWDHSYTESDSLSESVQGPARTLLELLPTSTNGPTRQHEEDSCMVDVRGGLLAAYRQVVGGSSC